VEFEQNGEDRAKYGEKLLVNLEKQFAGSGIKGMTERRFREYRGSSGKVGGKENIILI